MTDGMQNVCNFNIAYSSAVSPRVLARVEPFDVFLFAAARLFTAAKGTEGGGVGSASRLVRPLDVFEPTGEARPERLLPLEKDRLRLGPSLDARLTLGNGDELAVTRVFGVDGNFVERGVESKVDFVHTLHSRESNEDVHTVLFGHLHDGVRGHGFIGGNDENVSQNCDCYDAQDDGPETVGELGGEFFDGVAAR